MLKGHSPPSIVKELNVCNATVYKDIKFLTEKSKKYVYDTARGLHFLLYQRAIEGIGLTLENACDKFNDPKVPEKQKVSYLRLTKECHSAMIELIANGPNVMAIQDITDRAKRLGIDTSDYYKRLALSEEQQIRNYTNKKYVRSSGREFRDTDADTDTDINESE